MAADPRLFREILHGSNKALPASQVFALRGGEGLFTGMGYWTRANLECCLLATRGAPMRPAMDVHQIVTTPIGEHSAKPGEVRSRIQRLVAGPYLELFARQATPGWTSWGNEIEG